jgi:hypothetical protein
VKKIAALVFLVLLPSCYAEWDIPRTPRRDPCTNVIEYKYVYVQPTCPNPVPRNPRDFGDK